jgi:hypothetical protein
LLPDAAEVTISEEQYQRKQWSTAECMKPETRHNNITTAMIQNVVVAR